MPRRNAMPRSIKPRSTFWRFQELPIDDMAHVIGLVSKFSDTRTLTPQQAGELAEPLGQVAFLLADGSMVMKQNIELNQAFLEGASRKGIH